MYAIDFHAHVFPGKLADKAVPSLASAAGIEARGNGKTEQLKQFMDEAGIRKTVLVSIATKPEQADSINQWLMGIENDCFIPFAALHPDDPERFRRIKKIQKSGFRGVKLHPNYQGFYPDEKKIVELCKALADSGLILVLHGGADKAFAEVNASPERIARLIEAAPEIKLVVAHFGGFDRWLDAEKHLAGSDVFFDISFTLSYIKDEDFLRIARKHGTDKLVFGSDYPWQDPREHIRHFQNLDLSPDIKKDILHRNAEKLLGMEKGNF